MRHFVVASHGKLAEGMMSALNIIMGDIENIRCFTAYLDLSEDVEKKVADLVDEYPEEDELVVITDVYGGSVCNMFVRHLDKPNLHIIAGMNLGMLLEVLVNRDKPLNDLIDIAVNSGKQAVCYCNQKLDDDEDFD